MTEHDPDPIDQRATSAAPKLKLGLEALLEALSGQARYRVRTG